MFDEFYDAAVFGELETVKRILQENPGIINEKDEFGFTALHGVAGEEQNVMMKYLIENGANVNAENDEGITPLHLATYSETVDVLTNFNANINHQAHDGSTALHTQAAEAEGSECIEALLKRGADKTLKNQDNETAYDIAIAREEEDKIGLLRIY